jgi:hypothetical protein
MARMDYCLKCEMTRTDTVCPVCPVCGERTLPSWALVQALSDALEDIQQALSAQQSATDSATASNLPARVDSES